MKTYDCKLKISESGKTIRLVHANGRPFAEILVDGPLAVAAYNAENNIPRIKGRVNMFRGELIALEKDEILDMHTERILDRDEVATHTEDTNYEPTK